MLIFEGDQKDFILSRKKLCEQPGNQYSYPDFCSPTANTFQVWYLSMIRE